MIHADRPKERVLETPGSAVSRDGRRQPTGVPPVSDPTPERNRRDPRHLKRPRLLGLLEAEAARPLLALVAPAGFGKTDLLAEWLTGGTRPAVLLSVGERDNDPAALLGLLARAFERVSELGPGEVADLDADGVSPWAGNTASLGAALRRCERPFAIVLDDAEKLTNPAAIDVVVAFAGHLPPDSQVVIAARQAASWPLARLVAAGRAATIGQAELAFDADEVRALLVEAGVRGAAPIAEQILARSEGWPIGDLPRGTRPCPRDRRRRPRRGRRHRRAAPGLGVREGARCWAPSSPPTPSSCAQRATSSAFVRRSATPSRDAPIRPTPCAASSARACS